MRYNKNAFWEKSGFENAAYIDSYIARYKQLASESDVFMPPHQIDLMSMTTKERLFVKVILRDKRHDDYRVAMETYKKLRRFCFEYYSWLTMKKFKEFTRAVY